jgi:hypothetical protein
MAGLKKMQPQFSGLAEKIHMSAIFITHGQTKINAVMFPIVTRIN